MAFITKQAIESSWNRCTDLLDLFGDKEIRAAARVINSIDQNANLDEDKVDRVAIFVYLSHLKHNSNETDEHSLYITFYTLNIAFAAIIFTSHEYNKKETKNIN